MLRSIAFAFLAALATPLAAQQLASVATPALRPAIVVSDEIVRIGDFIENAGAASDIAIFRAPEFGQTGTVAAARVIEAARQHHVFAVDARNLAEIAVTPAQVKPTRPTPMPYLSAVPPSCTR